MYHKFYGIKLATLNYPSLLLKCTHDYKDQHLGVYTVDYTGKKVKLETTLVKREPRRGFFIMSHSLFGPIIIYQNSSWHLAILIGSLPFSILDGRIINHVMVGIRTRALGIEHVGNRRFCILDHAAPTAGYFE